MVRRVHIPRYLIGQSLRASELPDHGVPRSRIVQGEMSRPYHGVRAMGDRSGATIERCHDLEPMLLPGQFFSHTTALSLHGVPDLGSRERVHLSVEFPRTPPRGAGVAGHSLRRVEATTRHGLPVSSAATAWVQSGAVLAPRDLVAAADSLLTGRRISGVREPGAVTLAELEAATRASGRSPGIRALRWALLQARSGVDSVRETTTRLALGRQGLLEPETDVAITVARGLTFHVDLGYQKQRVALEYDGDQHRVDRERWMRDVDRYDLLREAGWTVIRVTALLLQDEAELAARVRRALSSSRA